METGEEIKSAKIVLQACLKARKTLRMYPSNNPIYINTLEDTFEKFKLFFALKDKLIFRIRLYDIYYEDERIYHNEVQKDENLAFFLYKDGLRELTFSKRMPFEEMTAFLKIISQDFENVVLDDDTVTLFWESDFRYIRYVVEDTFLADEDYESEAVSQATRVKNSPDQVKALAHHAVSIQEPHQKVNPPAIQAGDREMMEHELEADAGDKIAKLMDIIFEVFADSKTQSEVAESCGFLSQAIEYAIRNRTIGVVVGALERLKQIASIDKVSNAIKENIEKIFAFVGSEPTIYLLGEYLDTGDKTDSASVKKLIPYFDKNSIQPFMNLLSMLGTIHARKVVLEVLEKLCPLDFLTVVQGLDSPEWYVVRNIIYVLRSVGDTRAVDYLLKKIDHPDERVRLEIIRALGEMGGPRALPVLAAYLSDNTPIQLRLAAVRALGGLGSEEARNLLMAKISEKSFADKEFNEKKLYFQTLSRWKDKAVVDQLIEMLMKKRLFPDARADEKRACAAYCLGLIGAAEALPYLQKCMNARSRVLREFSHAAIEGIEHEAQKRV